MNAIRKYGEESFVPLKFDTASSSEELCQKEIKNFALALQKQKELGFPILARNRTTEHQRRAGCIANHKWHVKSGKINPNCPRCCPQEKSA